MTQPAEKPKLRLGDQLIDAGLITEDQLKIALLEQKQSKAQLGKILVTLGFVTEEVVRDVLGKALGQDSVDLENIVVDADVLAMMSQEQCRQITALPIAYDVDRATLVVAISDTFNVVGLDRIKATLGRGAEIEPVLASETQIEAAIDRFYGFGISLDSILQEIETGNSDFSDYRGDDAAYSHPMVRLVDAMLSDAVKKDSSDIHFEPEEGFLRIRYRIDGVMRQIRSLHIKYWPAINIRLKVMADMNIAESNLPQDGRITRSVGSRQIDFRVASQPTIHGENIVLRVLDRNKGILPLESMGLDAASYRTIRLMMSRPEGIILVTGPTGSGKTTTLYSMLSAMNNESVNIMTLEDPVEYPIPMIRQSSISHGKMDFAKGIKSLMRQDPDIILVGEVRDQETAEMAFRAAMTGHQVLTTLHTNSAIGAFARLYDIGMSAEVLGGNIIGIIGQRLLRKLCLHCREAYTPDELECSLLGVQASESLNLFRAGSCEHCSHTGYKGRIAVVEALRMDNEIDELVMNRATPFEIERTARTKGFQSLSDMAINHVIAGATSLDEATRKTDLTSRVS
jgi:type II secretory ATPase GspE/PulE/Tfp pilus assembly ATPase PilB-like protein